MSFFKRGVSGHRESFLSWLHPRRPRAESSCRAAISSSQWKEPAASDDTCYRQWQWLLCFLDESPRRASVLLLSLWEELRPEARPEGAHGAAHRRETLRLRALWQGLRTPALPTHPPPPALQQSDLHAASEGKEAFSSAPLKVPCGLSDRSMHRQTHTVLLIVLIYRWRLQSCCSLTAEADKEADKERVNASKDECKHQRF